MRNDIIPRFFLYGEPPQAVTERFLHLEPIDDRSRPANWNIRPHTHADLNHVFYIAQGDGEMLADAQTMALQAPCLALAPAGVVHGFCWASDTRGSVLTVSNGYLQDLAPRARSVLTIFAKPAVFPVPGGAGIGEAFERLTRELAWTAPGHDVAVEALLLTILVEALRLAQHGAAGAPSAIGPRAALVASFRAMVEARYRDGLSIEAYAEALGVHPKRLRIACLEVAGATPTRIVQDRCLLEAKRLMLYSNMTVAEVAYDLGFQDPAYFTRFFTQRCGTPPRRFRQREADRLSADSAGP